MPLVGFLFKVCGILLSPTARICSLGYRSRRGVAEGDQQGRQVIKSLLGGAGLGEMLPSAGRKVMPWGPGGVA